MSCGSCGGDATLETLETLASAGVCTAKAGWTTPWRHVLFAKGVHGTLEVWYTMCPTKGPSLGHDGPGFVFRV